MRYGRRSRVSRRPAIRRRRVYKRAAKKRFTKFANRVLRVAHEKKYVEFLTLMNSPQDTANDSIYTRTLTTIPQGDTENTRDGNQVYLRSIECHVRCIVNPDYLFQLISEVQPDNPWGPSTGGSQFPNWFNDKIRVLVWQWLPMEDGAGGAGGALPGSVLQNETTISPYNHDERKNFRILYDKSIRLAGQFVTQLAGPPETPISYGFPTHELADFKFRIRKFANRTLTWSGSTTTANNHVFLSVITDWSATPTSNISPVLVYHDIKTNFSDK